MQRMKLGDIREDCVQQRNRIGKIFLARYQDFRQIISKGFKVLPSIKIRSGDISLIF